MVSLLAFLWANWSWLTALFGAPFALVLFAAGRRTLAWIVIAAAIVLVLYAAIGGARDWLAAYRDEVRAARDTEWQAELGRQRLAAQAAQLTAARDDYERGLAKGAELATAAAGDRAANETTIEKVIHDSPSAESCRYDAAAAAGSNGLRERPD